MFFSFPLIIELAKYCFLFLSNIFFISKIVFSLSRFMPLEFFRIGKKISLGLGIYGFPYSLYFLMISIGSMTNSSTLKFLSFSLLTKDVFAPFSNNLLIRYGSRSS